MLYRLIAMRILPHPSDLHLPDLMDHLPVITVIKGWRHHKNGIEHRYKLLLPTHQPDQTLNVMEHPPRIMPAVPLRKRVAPFERIEGRLPASVLVFSPHEL